MNERRLAGENNQSTDGTTHETTVDKRRNKFRPDEVLTFSLDLGLTDIPEPAHSCTNCGSHLQREFLAYESKGNHTVVMSKLPVYGCTGCELKADYVPVTIQLLKGISASFSSVGENNKSRLIDEEVTLLENTQTLDS